MVKGISLVVLIALGVSFAFGQGSTATISGVVRDTSGALVPGVSVTVKHVEQGLTRTAQSNESGAYVRFRSEPWRAAYAARIGKIFAALGDAGLKVIWCGNPIARSPTYSEDMSFINDIYAAEAARFGAQYLSLWTAVAGRKQEVVTFAVGFFIMLPISTVILVVSMIVSSALAGGMDFGDVRVAIHPTAALLRRGAACSAKRSGKRLCASLIKRSRVGGRSC